MKKCGSGKMSSKGMKGTGYKAGMGGKAAKPTAKKTTARRK